MSSIDIRYDVGSKVWPIQQQFVGRDRCRTCGKTIDPKYAWVPRTKVSCEVTEILIRTRKDYPRSIIYCLVGPKMHFLGNWDEKDCFTTRREAILACRERNIKGNFEI